MARKKNTWFQFKQFRIEQDKAGMKVTTDACLFAALIEVAEAQRILDIGTGTGLLALMLAQRSPAQIDAVEINEEVAKQAASNFGASPWAKRIQIHQADLAHYRPAAPYDLIVSNPPFFSGHTGYEDLPRDQAMSASYLPFQALAVFIRDWLSPKGASWVLLPDHEAGLFRQEAMQAGLAVQEEIIIRNYTDGPIFRRVIVYGHNKKALPARQDLVIYAEPNAQAYTDAFRQLLAPYYLYL